MTKTKVLGADFTGETNWLTPNQCAALTGLSVSALEKRRNRGHWPPYSMRSGRPKYPGDLIRREMAAGMVENTVQATTLKEALTGATQPPAPVIVPPKLYAANVNMVGGKPYLSMLWGPDYGSPQGPTQQQLQHGGKRGN
ncbi:MAG: hypothetical protein ACK4Y9_12295 [Hyphomonas sp.]